MHIDLVGSTTCNQTDLHSPRRYFFELIQNVNANHHGNYIKNHQKETFLSREHPQVRGFIKLLKGDDKSIPLQLLGFSKLEETSALGLKWQVYELSW